MNKYFLAGLLGLVFIYGFTIQKSEDNCDKKGLTASCKNKLETYKYDSQKFTRIYYTPKEQLLETEVPVFIGEKYRLVFNTSALPKGIVISVYTKDKDAKKRDEIYSSKNEKAGENELVFDISHVRKLFVDYTVPEDSSVGATGEKLSGCVIFMVGYN